MEVLNHRAALLSNYEVLSLLRELESDHLARAQTALRIKKEEEAAGNPPKVLTPAEEICENLRTVEVEAIQYLSADFQPTGTQSDAGIASLTRSLAAYELTKAEKLQVVNLAPVEPVELYVIVEELEDRFGEHMDDMLATVRSSLSESAVLAVPVTTDIHAEAFGGGDTNMTYSTEDAQVYAEDNTAWVYDANEIIFDDTGEGMGVEGDLDMNDD
ncbi:RNA polymerase Rpb4-domain-containing protein [Amylocystis lapponica]|nr:RNA polymerase Rpb4-domain-containing protein [Amylocystis lapponica]